jgi:2-isopropylmalate synthase
MILEAIYRINTGIKKERLVETSRLVSRFSGIAIPPTQPIVGENVFSHESGIHSHGVMKNAATFEPGIMTPEMVGHRRRLTLGKHVGRHAVNQMLSEVHIVPGETQLDAIVEKVKAIANKGKRVTDADLYEIAQTVMEIELSHKMLDLMDIAIMTGNHMIPTASVKAMVNGKEHIFSAVGNGPVDAALKAIFGIVPARVQLKEFNIEAIAGGVGCDMSRHHCRRRRTGKDLRCKRERGRHRALIRRSARQCDQPDQPEIIPYSFLRDAYRISLSAFIAFSYP